MNAPLPETYVCDQVQAVRNLHVDLFTDQFRRLSIRDQIDLQAERLLAAHREGNAAAATHLTCWHPLWKGNSRDRIMSRDATIADGRETMSREYGYENWADVVVRGVNPPEPTFETAVDTILSGDITALSSMLESVPVLVRQRSSFGHRATLLHYIAANGVETHRQVVPKNIPDITSLLIDAGADVNAKAKMYGGGCTTIALVTSSSHPAVAGVADELERRLLEAGAAWGQS